VSRTRFRDIEIHEPPYCEKKGCHSILRFSWELEAGKCEQCLQEEDEQEKPK
jgi:hypothetical protein